jgi:glucokinase
MTTSSSRTHSRCTGLDHIGGAAGIDCGGRRARFFDGQSFRPYNSCEFAQAEDMLEEHFTAHNGIPACVVLALPGNPDKYGIWSMVNLPWQVSREGLEAAFGTRFEIINDLQAALLGTRHFDRSKLNLLKLGKPAADCFGNELVLTLSTGVNGCLGFRVPELAPAREMGWTRLGVDPGSDSWKLIEYLSNRDGKPVAVEHLLGGRQGIANIAEFLCRGSGDLVSAKHWPVVSQIDRSMLGIEMTSGALAGFRFWVEVATLYGELLGYLLNRVVIDGTADEIIIQGSVLNRTPGFAEWLFRHTPVVELMVSLGGEKDFIARDCSVYGVPPPLELGVIGAYNYAEYLRSQLV